MKDRLDTKEKMVNNKIIIQTMKRGNPSDFTDSLSVSALTCSSVVYIKHVRCTHFYTLIAK